MVNQINTNEIVGKRFLIKHSDNTTKDFITCGTNKLLKINSLFVCIEPLTNQVSTSGAITIKYDNGTEFPIINNLPLQHGEAVQVLEKYIYVTSGEKITVQCEPALTVSYVAFGEELTE